jgi:hypothetical protein
LGAVLAAVAAAGPVSTTNLLLNGSFDDARDPLAGWQFDYRVDDNRWYAANHECVSAARDGARKGVLELRVPSAGIAQNQGVKVDSLPVPFESDAAYRLSLWARTTGPDCRILIQGYQWKPGIAPHASPPLHELRLVYRQGAGKMLYFGGRTSGAFSGVTRVWSPGACSFPSEDVSDLAAGHLKRVQFLSIHVVAIGGGAGSLFLDDVVLEKTGKREQKR